MSSPSKLKNNFSLNFNRFAVDKGSYLHKVMEELDFTSKYDYDFLKNNYSKLSDKNIESIICFLNSNLIQENIGVNKEVSYYEKNINGLVNGYMDLVVEKENEIILIDYKSDINEDKEYFLKEYRLQIKSYYDFLIKHYPGKKVRAFIYSFNLKEFIEFLF